MTPLIIDRRSASVQLMPDQVRAWGQGQRVFVSSLITDMPDERAAARRAIVSVGATPVMFEEDLGGQDVSAEQAYLSGVRASSVYLGIWGTRYGVRMSDGYSATEAEYQEAKRIGSRICLFVNGVDAGVMDGAQRDLIASARNVFTTGSWTTPEDLERRIATRLADLAAEELAPWVRVGDVLLRAREVSTDGTSMAVAAEVRDAQVHVELERLREQRADVPFATPFSSGIARVEQLRSSQRVQGVYEEQLELRVGSLRNPLMWTSVNGIPANDLFERSLSDALFGTTLVPAGLHWGQSAVDPLAPLRGANLDDAVLRSAAGLLLGEFLRNSGMASSIDSFVLGPNRSGTRTLSVTWRPPKRYSNEPSPEPRTLVGTVSGL